jgi:hypothetical protein
MYRLDSGSQKQYNDKQQCGQRVAIIHAVGEMDFKHGAQVISYSPSKSETMNAISYEQ